MKPWDVYTCDFAGAGSHPAVILSTESRTQHKPTVNILLCSSHRTTRPPQINEVLLNGEDGLDWETLCKCDIVYVAKREQLTNKRGNVSGERRRQIAEKIVRSLGLAGL